MVHPCVSTSVHASMFACQAVTSEGTDVRAWREKRKAASRIRQQHKGHDAKVAAHMTRPTCVLRHGAHQQHNSKHGRRYLVLLTRHLQDTSRMCDAEALKQIDSRVGGAHHLSGFCDPCRCDCARTLHPHCVNPFRASPPRLKDDY